MIKLKTFPTARLASLAGCAALILAVSPSSAQNGTGPQGADATDINGIYVSTNGDVGVGTNAPTADLHVRGDMHTEGRLSGNGYQGRYNGAPLFNAANTLGNPAGFVFVFDELNFGKTPQAIQIMNPDANVYKTFVIGHPVDEARYLVHATLEGPEGAVFYRGSAQLENGEATVRLPDYFEALTKEEGRTIQLTNVGGFDPLAIRLTDGKRIRDGAFSVISQNVASAQRFDWEVKATRKDKPDLEVEPLRSDMIVSGLGPYKIGMKRMARN